MPALHDAKWETICRSYVLQGLSRTEAYKQGFPKCRCKTDISLYNVASRFFKRKKIADRVEELVQEKADVAREEFAVDAMYILQQLVDVVRTDVQDILTEDGYVKPIKEWPAVWRQYIQALDVEELFAGRGDMRLQIGTLKKIKWPDKLRALELLGKHVNVSAFKEIQELQGAGGGPVKVITTAMTPQEAAEAYADTLRNG